MVLSDRLQIIANEINIGETMADIGTDHGFLPLFLLETKKCSKVIMADISNNSLNKARENMSLSKVSGQGDFRCGNGIDVLADGEVDAVVIAGMGGLLIAEILEWNLKKTHSIKKYILQPRNNAGRLRFWLDEHGFKITKNSLVNEGKYICEIITAEAVENKVTKGKTYDVTYDFPDSLVDNINGLSKEFFLRNIEKETYILNRIRENSTAKHVEAENAEKRLYRLNQLLKDLEKSHEE